MRNQLGLRDAPRLRGLSRPCARTSLAEEKGETGNFGNQPAGESPDRQGGRSPDGSESCVAVRPGDREGKLRSVDSERMGRGVVPKEPRDGGRRAGRCGRQYSACQIAGAPRPGTSASELHRDRGPGHVRKGWAGTWEIPLPPVKAGNGRASASERGRGIGKSEHRNRSDDVGEPDRRDPAEQRAVPEVGTERGNDGRDIELTNHLHET